MLHTQTYIALLFLLFVVKINAQENEFTKNSIKTGIGFGFNRDAKSIEGLGFLYSIGYQRTFGEKEKLRLNQTILQGWFDSRAILDTRDQFYKSTSLCINLDYDLIRYRAISLLGTAGVFVSSTKGLLGTGGEIEHQGSEYFRKFDAGCNLGIGIRINPRKNRIAYEIRPLTGQVGYNGFTLLHMMFGIDIKLK